VYLRYDINFWLNGCWNFKNRFGVYSLPSVYDYVEVFGFFLMKLSHSPYRDIMGPELLAGGSKNRTHFMQVMFALIYVWENALLPIYSLQNRMLLIYSTRRSVYLSVRNELNWWGVGVVGWLYSTKNVSDRMFKKQNFFKRNDLYRPKALLFCLVIWKIKLLNFKPLYSCTLSTITPRAVDSLHQLRAI
jgi:hypothetical protein